MGYWIGVNGSYHEGDRISASDRPCAPKPSAFHVLTGVVSLDPEVCWRGMTQAEIDALKAQLASSVANGVAFEDVVKAAFLVVLDGVNTLRGLHTLPAVTPAQFKQAIINKLPNP